MWHFLWKLARVCNIKIRNHTNYSITTTDHIFMTLKSIDNISLLLSSLYSHLEHISPQLALPQKSLCLWDPGSQDTCPNFCQRRWTSSTLCCPTYSVSRRFLYSGWKIYSCAWFVSCGISIYATPSSQFISKSNGILNKSLKMTICPTPPLEPKIS